MAPKKRAVVVPPGVHVSDEGPASSSRANGSSKKTAMVVLKGVYVNDQGKASRANITSSSRSHAKPTTSSQPSLTFLQKVEAHYTRQSDTLSLAFFNHLCNNFNSGAINERGFYVGVYRLFAASGADGLWRWFQKFLPGAWKELGWLEQAVGEDVDCQMRLAGMSGGVRKKMDAGDVDADIAEEDVLMLGSLSERAGPVEEQTAASVKRKKKVPIDGYRAVRVSHIVGILEDASILDLPPKKATNPEKPATPPSSQKTTKTARRVRLALPPPPLFSEITSTTPATEPTVLKMTHPTSTTSRSIAKQPRLSLFTSPTLSTAPTTPTAGSGSTTPSDSNNQHAPTARIRKPTQSTTRSLPLAPASSTIYPNRRAIFARPETKPYIHALCGARFGFPEEVRRHHNGQMGRPGCWELNGNPEGEGTEWNAHDSSKICLGKIVYHGVEGGFVVDDWGDFGKWVSEDGGESSVVAAAEERRGRTGERVKKAKKKRTLSSVDDEEDESGGDELVVESESGEQTDREGAKVKKCRIADQEGGASTVQRAAALGLRVRK